MLETAATSQLYSLQFPPSSRMTADTWTALTGRRWASLTDDATGHGGFVSVRTTNLFVIVGQTDAFFSSLLVLSSDSRKS